MCARKKRNLTTYGLLLLVLHLLASSCTKDDSTVSYNDYCYIKSVTLGTVKRVVEKRDRQGDVVSTIRTSFAGSMYAMTIDHRNNTIENRDSLPYGSQLYAVLATITFDGSMVAYREKGSNGEWTAYNSTDSLNLTTPLELYTVSNDAKSNRIYTLKVNVHRQEGDSLYWKQCESEVEPLTGMTDMKSFVLNGKLMVLGQKASGIVLAERNSTEAQGSWESEQLTNLPYETDLQTLRQQDGTLYISTSDGRILSSTDAKDWQQMGAIYTAGLTLVEKTANYFYAISEGRLIRSTDAIAWEDDALDTKADFLPETGIRALTLRQTNGSDRIVMMGQRSDCTNTVVWNKMWNDGWKAEEKDATWIYFPFSADNTIPCPRLQYLNLLPYDGKCIAFGGASMDESRKALDVIYISQDYGITWRPGTELHLPALLEGTEGCITSTVDKNNFIWIITNAQVWRGRLNRLGFAQQ
ncbi:MAG: hypothetical protein IKQ37_04125 [Bacteroidaceae bacterium]|nr:hypothetical protein [Bacteroidaceae bacterium]